MEILNTLFYRWVKSLFFYFKGTQAWDNFDIFWPESKLYMPLVNFRKKISIIFLPFSPEFRCSNIFAVAEHTRNQTFLVSYQNFFSTNFHFCPFRWVPRRFSEFQLFIVKICILIRYCWVILKNYIMRMLSIRRINFIAHWAYEDMI